MTSNNLSNSKLISGKIATISAINQLLLLIFAVVFILIVIVSYSDTFWLSPSKSVDLPFAGKARFDLTVYVIPIVLILLQIYLAFQIYHLQNIDRKLSSENNIEPMVHPLKHYWVSFLFSFSLYWLTLLVLIISAWRSQPYIYVSLFFILSFVISAVISFVSSIYLWQKQISKKLTVLSIAVMFSLIWIIYFADHFISEYFPDQFGKIKPVTWRSFDASNQNINGLYISGSNIDFKFADFSKSTITSDSHDNVAVFRNKDFTGAIFFSSTLVNVDFIETIFYGAHFNEAMIKNTKFFEDDFSCASLNNIYVENSVFLKSKFIEAKLRSSDLKNSNFELSNFRCADLSYTKLNGANLQGANLQCTNLKGAILDNTDLLNVKNLTLQQLRQTTSYVGAKVPDNIADSNSECKNICSFYQETEKNCNPDSKIE